MSGEARVVVVGAGLVGLGIGRRLAQAGREVLVVDVSDAPGGLGRVMRRFADADVNVDLVYLTADGHLVIGPDDLERAREAASRA